MKNVRLIAWLLIIAMMALTGSALGEAPELELADAPAAEPAELEVEAGEDAFDLPDADGPGFELPDLELSGILSVDLDEAPEGGDEANGAPDGAKRLHYSGSGIDNDRLFAGYVDLLFGKKPQGDLRSNGFIGDTLTGTTKKLYDCLLKQIEKVADGSRSSTTFDIPTSIATDDAWDEISRDFGTIIDALLTDCPYHLFWFDKTEGVWAASDSRGALSFKFCVEDEYADWSGEVTEGVCFTTDAARIKSAHVAVSKAKNVVKQNAGATDYKKLCAYRNFICKAVDYHDDAAEDPYWPYGNPWQLIWVFDSDPDTNVVCEGYAKAFQYLCDLTSFNGNVQSHIVYGDAIDRSGSGPHMWNIVTMGDGKNYHVDVTFIDGGFDELFLCGVSSTEYENTYLALNQIYYRLDGEVVALYPAKTLKMSASDYDPDSYQDPKPVKPTKVTIAQGKSATLYMGNQLSLKAKLTPANASTQLTWSSNKKSVATVDDDGVVTPRKAGKAVITVKTANGKSAKITVKVVDASKVKLKKGGTTLKKGQKIKLARGKTLTLKASVSPSKVKTSLTWTSNYKYVTVKDGEVTVSKNAKAGTKAKITVKTANKKSTYIYIVVK